MDFGDFYTMLDELVEDIRDHQPSIVALDFNAWATEWESIATNTKRRKLLESFALLDIVLLNDSHKSTFVRKNARLIVDLSYARTCLVHKLAWEVSESYTHSYHQSICMEV